MPILLDDSKVISFNFPGGECQIRLPYHHLKRNETANVVALIQNSDDVMSLLLTIDAIRRENPKVKIELEIPYFPYARQDRVCNSGEALSAAVMAGIINNLNCDKVFVTDPHSDVVPALLKNCIVIDQAEIIANTQVFEDIKEMELTLVSPDAGAAKKVEKAAKRLAGCDCKTEIVYCSKKRDTMTGDILGVDIACDNFNRDFIIVDDICDGGRTFIELAKEFKAKGSGDLYLYVTHGIFSKGLDVLREHFRHVYCYHTFLPLEKRDPSFLTILGGFNVGN